MRWNDWLRSVAELRVDSYRFKVDSEKPANSGRVSDRSASPNLALVFGPRARPEYYINAGTGSHSNDARFLHSVQLSFTPHRADWSPHQTRSLP